MPKFETYRKQAKLLVRWHRQGNHSVGGRIRGLPRYANFTDREALAHLFTLAEAQEVIAREAGEESWAALKTACSGATGAVKAGPADLHLTSAVPVLFVSDVERSANFYRDKLAFTIDFLHGHPAFYGSVSRDGARLHLKWTNGPVFGDGRPEAESLIMAFLSVENVNALYAEFVAAGVMFSQSLTKQAWGGKDFHVRDPDGNILAFVG